MRPKFISITKKLHEVPTDPIVCGHPPIYVPSIYISTLGACVSHAWAEQLLVRDVLELTYKSHYKFAKAILHSGLVALKVKI